MEMAFVLIMQECFTAQRDIVSAHTQLREVSGSAALEETVLVGPWNTCTNWWLLSASFLPPQTLVVRN